MDLPKVTIIIPVKTINEYIRESLGYLQKLDYPNFEVIILPDGKEILKSSDIHLIIIKTGSVGPAEKRDMGAKVAKGEILAFLDDDAYPKADWLKKVIKIFKKSKIAAVGGPAITPESDGFWQKVSGAVFESYLGGGGARNRYLPIGKKRSVDDWPTVNLLVRKNIFLAVGGFDTNYWPGEDTKLCLDIINRGYKIIYEPRAIVYHHRRGDMIKHFKQVGNYAMHRGYFAKKYPETSLRLWYFMPTFFDLYLISFFILLFWLKHFPGGMFYAIPLFIYVLGLGLDGILIAWRWKNPLVGLMVMPIIILTHIWYGIRFIWGMIIDKLDR